MRILPNLALALVVASSLFACADPEPRDDLLERPDDIGAISGGSALGGPTKDPVLCAGVTVDPTGARDASGALRLCIASAAAKSVLSLPPGTYRLDSTVGIDRDDLTLTTAGLLGSTATCLRGTTACARFVPGPGVFPGQALVEVGRARAANRVTLDHLVFDGDGARRRANAAEAHASCSAGGGRNLQEYGGDSVTLQYSASVHAMCGTAAGWAAGRVGTHSTIRGCYFADNGIDYREAQGFWSDGLTIGLLHDSAVTGNVFEDNTDVALILGGATGTTVVNDNLVGQLARHAFAGVMLTNWSALVPATSGWADFRGLEMARNQVICRGSCDIAMQIGVLPWFYDATKYIDWRLMGGNVHDNHIQSEKQGVVVAGAGTPVYPLRMAGNVIDVTPQTSTAMFAKPGIRATGRLDVYAPGSENFVVYGAGQEASLDGAEAWHGVF